MLSALAVTAALWVAFGLEAGCSNRAHSPPAPDLLDATDPLPDATDATETSVPEVDAPEIADVTPSEGSTDGGDAEDTPEPCPELVPKCHECKVFFYHDYTKETKLDGFGWTQQFFVSDVGFASKTFGPDGITFVSPARRTGSAHTDYSHDMTSGEVGLQFKIPGGGLAALRLRDAPSFRTEISVVRDATGSHLMTAERDRTLVPLTDLPDVGGGWVTMRIRLEGDVFHVSLVELKYTTDLKIPAQPDEGKATGFGFAGDAGDVVVVRKFWACGSP